MKTKSMLLAPFAVAILSYGAFAADLPRQRDVGYTAPPAPVATWTGYYIGGNIGYGWGRTENDATVVGLPPVLFGLSTASLARGDRDRQDINGVIGGFQSGYNWQAGSWVMGIESICRLLDRKATRCIAIWVGPRARWPLSAPLTNCRGSEPPGAALAFCSRPAR